MVYRTLTNEFWIKGTLVLNGYYMHEMLHVHRWIAVENREKCVEQYITVEVNVVKKGTNRVEISKVESQMSLEGFSPIFPMGIVLKMAFASEYCPELGLGAFGGDGSHGLGTMKREYTSKLTNFDASPRKSIFRLGIHGFLVESVSKYMDVWHFFVCCSIFHLGLGKNPLERNGVVDLKHGVYKCMGAVLEPRSVLTCCTCVSDVYLLPPCEQDPEPYEIRALEPLNVTLKSDKDTLKVEEVLIHPDCDVDGSYDYAIVRVRAAAANPCAPRSRQASMYSLNAVEVALRTKVRNRTCMLVTNLEFEKTNTNKTVMIPVTFVDTQHCWVSSDTVDWFDSKYCVRAQDGTHISEIKTGSPIFCEGRLIGISARKYATTGRQFTAVNGIDGALDFIKETIFLTLPKAELDEDEGLVGIEGSRTVGKKFEKSAKIEKSTELNEAAVRGS